MTFCGHVTELKFSKEEMTGRHLYISLFYQEMNFVAKLDSFYLLKMTDQHISCFIMCKGAYVMWFCYLYRVLLPLLGLSVH